MFVFNTVFSIFYCCCFVFYLLILKIVDLFISILVILLLLKNKKINKVKLVHLFIFFFFLNSSPININQFQCRRSISFIIIFLANRGITNNTTLSFGFFLINPLFYTVNMENMTTLQNGNFITFLELKETYNTFVLVKTSFFFSIFVFLYKFFSSYPYN